MTVHPISTTMTTVTTVLITYCCRAVYQNMLPKSFTSASNESL